MTDNHAAEIVHWETHFNKDLKRPFVYSLHILPWAPGCESFNEFPAVTPNAHGPKAHLYFTNFLFTTIAPVWNWASPKKDPAVSHFIQHPEAINKFESPMTQLMNNISPLC